MIECVKQDSLVTLNYRIATRDETEIISTFGSRPATLQMGNAELAPNLEQCLLGLAVGQRKLFVLEPAQAYGPHDSKLVQRLPRANLPEKENIVALSLLEFTAPNGARYSGLVRELDDEAALVDFNHPLAGKSIRFEVEIIGVI